MVSLVHPYRPLLKLPVGGQYGQKGQSINIPVPVAEICSQLSKSADDSMVLVKSPKDDKISHLVNANRVFDALHWLKLYNPLYGSVSITLNKSIALESKEIATGMGGEFDTGHSFQDLSLIPNDYTVPCITQKPDPKNQDT